MKEADEVRLHFLDYWRVLRVRAGIITLAFLLVVITAGVYTYFAPRLYQSMVKIEVQPDAQKTLKVFEGTAQVGIDPRFSSTQFQIIQSKEILYPVIDTLQLAKKWAPGGMAMMPKEQAFYRLLGMMNVREVRNTDLLAIEVSSTDRQEAADIANTIANTYQRRRISEQQGLVNSSLAQLGGEIEKQQRKVEEAFANKERVRKELGILEVTPDSVESPSQVVDTLLVDVEKQVNDARLKAAALRTKLDQIEILKGDDLMRALPTLEIQDPAVAKILPLYQDTVALEARYLQSGLGQNHPLVKSNRAQKEVYQQQLDSQITSLRKSLETNARISENTLEMLEKKLGDLRTEQQSSRSRAADYIEAKAKYIEAKKVLEGAQLKASTTTIEATMPQHPISIWENAEPATFPSKPNVKLNMLLACLVGLIVGIGIAFFVEYLDTSVKTMEDVESYLGVPVMAVVPNRIRLLHKDTKDSPDAEAYRILRTNIEFNRKKADDNTLTFVSGGPGEGKSTTVCNLGYICAQGGYNVLIVDADLRRPTQHLLLEIENEAGLGNYLNTNLRLEDVIVRTSVENLSLLPAGPSVLDPSGLLNSQRMSDAVRELKARYDIVLFDSPPILGVSDASVLASEADSTIIVVQHRRFPRSMLARVKQAVLKVGGNLLGVVLNNVDLKHDPESQYYTSYYNYYREPERKPAKAIAKPAAPAGPAKETVEVGKLEDY